jgi:hypothetical protein
MAFFLDSLRAVVLFVAAMLSWRMTRGVRSGTRINMRFACVLNAALAAALIVPIPGLGFDVALLSPALAATALALALCFPQKAPIWFSTFAFILALAAGLLAVLAAVPAVALALQTGAAGLIFVSAFSRLGENPRGSLGAGLGATSLFLGAMTVMNGSLSAAALFFSAALLLLTRVSQAAVAEDGRHGHFLISGKHA